MKPEFPGNFDLSELSGPRGSEFATQSDAFQQLVGEGLQTAPGFLAHVAATKGNDGSIDAWIELIPDAPSPFRGLATPAIVECKDHDDSLRNFSDNITAQWRKTREKLKNAAEGGWTRLFLPWKDARAYVYCVSAVIPQGIREHLTQSIRAFFAELAANQRSLIV